MWDQAFYKKIIDQSPVGYAYHKIVTDKKGNPTDYIYLEVNPAFEKITGLDSDKIIGKPVTKVLPGIKKGDFDWIGFFGDVALKGKEKSYNQYVEPLKKWVRGNVFSPEPGYFVLYTIEVTGEQMKIEGLKKISDTSESFLHGIGGKIPYQQLADTLLEISEGKFAAMNLYSEDGKKYKTVAIAGNRQSIEKAMEIMGIKIVGKEWEIDSLRAELIKNNTVNRFSTLYEFLGEQLPKTVCNLLTKTFGIGETVFVKIRKSNEMLGDFTIFMPKESSFRNDTLVEMYGRHLGLMIDRGRMDKALKDNNDDQATLLDISTQLMSATSRTLDTIIERTMEKASKIAAADRVYVFEYDFQEQVSNNIYEWCAEGVEPQIHELQGIPLEEAQAWLNHHQEKRTVVIEDVQAMNDGDPIKSILEPKGVKSGISVPLVMGETLFGFIGFETVKTSYHYTTDQKNLLQQYGNDLLSTLLRIQSNRVLQEQKEEIEYLSFHDHLTGLYNRRYFETELKRLDTERNLPITVIMGDLNGLKLVNDSFGHVVGDKLLVRAAEVMKTNCRLDEIIARTGGDEYAILLPGIDGSIAEKLIDRIKRSLEKETMRGVDVSVSFGYATKTSTSEGMAEVLKKAEDQMYNNKLFEGPGMRGKVIDKIISAINRKSPREEDHANRVSEICAKMGEALGMKNHEVNELRAFGLLHDIGKIAISDKILNKPGTLTEEEFNEMRRHAEIGYRILSTTNDLAELAEFVLYHHERWDGNGYPKGLVGEEIPLQARICSVAESYDTMTTHQPYRSAMTVEEALKELENNSGTQFDPELVEVFIQKARSGEIE